MVETEAFRCRDGRGPSTPGRALWGALQLLDTEMAGSSLAGSPVMSLVWFRGASLSASFSGFPSVAMGFLQEKKKKRMFLLTNHMTGHPPILLPVIKVHTQFPEGKYLWVLSVTLFLPAAANVLSLGILFA